jgi:hypothetical protein
VEPLIKIPVVRMLAASILAQETNGEYLGSKAIVPKDKVQNKQLMSKFLLESDPRVEERISAAEEMIAYCNTKMIELLAGNLTGYWKAILETVAKETIGIQDYSDWGIIASIPSAYMRSVDRDAAMEVRERAAHTSMHFGKPGDRYSGIVHVVSKMFSVKYNKTWYTGLTEEGNLVNFPYSKTLAMDCHYKINSKIRKHGDDATTLLHYVSIEVDNDAKDAII